MLTIKYSFSIWVFIEIQFMLSIIIQYYTIIALGLHEVCADLEVELIFSF